MRNVFIAIMFLAACATAPTTHPTTPTPMQNVGDSDVACRNRVDSKEEVILEGRKYTLFHEVTPGTFSLDRMTIEEFPERFWRGERIYMRGETSEAIVNISRTIPHSRPSNDLSTIFFEVKVVAGKLPKSGPIFIQRIRY
ncbi:hypothetical protein A3B21_03980 [Candidatus Uhrbacteria bacterium RIFCSPLOWO2_01_FULL_47_24]|uniref:Lipoprotein n=1 Tax=Candidatus Uhrbacteria bacterium RIFCSPLOWO2_01_FULL_47_24 TaxID=1802401 RepID=A0A1F7UT68_9BACT|nr:MAG: hypothetical protein A3D58_02685 [Candidatus Uhrbacteria bacterium RIFCSPHIGHO2_02_FULL_46_47]OGL75739.1 MAG: hypothetical protein A3F52_02410 [Candidatus Uhrbacteria bacterium RIFCSPHIGHO2_12_FULL_47_11]OGL81500.1 MAG: hypothetical protein A3B21_03980 [Candidatus Uhrbacteria bacterium RIFCSPLOWO2_01_FULL_47_24]OGL83745.1 MAG: hypothetical protein A3J03_01435 [Candidatus Uhrbacteria bacterium RIFCSPLOWO2_02_FULL_46_25]OGL93614.1 MAG: hypothetical protein A3H11_05315 [Candidatus Uhrbacte